jgi:hypothetical protein
MKLLPGRSSRTIPECTFSRPDNLMPNFMPVLGVNAANRLLPAEQDKAAGQMKTKTTSQARSLVA